MQFPGVVISVPNPNNRKGVTMQHTLIQMIAIAESQQNWSLAASLRARLHRVTKT